MTEYIMQFDKGLLNEKTGEVVFKPSVVGKLIRCKDCAYLGDMYTKKKDGTEWHYCNEAIPSGVTPDDFCSYGEKKK